MSTRLHHIALATCALAAWLLLHPYIGIVHDSVIYSLLALMRLHPDTLSSDIFVRFGSQDQYTVFGPIFAALIKITGLEHAAALLTLIAHVAFFGSAWLLARRLMSSLAALLAMALLIVAPGAYGSGVYFHLAEGFITPRLPAEALVLAAIAATLGGRHWVALVCMVIAASLHPLMAAAGVVFLTLTFILPRKPRLILSACGLLWVASLVVVLAVTPLGRFDSEWLRIARVTSPFLYLATWAANDWTRLGIVVAILTIGLLTGTAPLVRRICTGALATAACGLVITALYSDVLHVVIFTDLQAWRWIWLTTVIATVLLPVIARHCWESGSTGRTSIVLLASAWCLHGDDFVLCLLPLSVLFAAAPARWREHSYTRLALWGSYALLLTAACTDIAAGVSYLPVDRSAGSPLLQQLRTACADGVIPGALIVGVWGLLQYSWTTRYRNLTLVAATILACVAQIPSAWQTWTYAFYTRALYDKLAPWRAAIPATAEVLWLDTPVGAWYLLDRPNYWSSAQVAGAIFSREKAFVMSRRTASVDEGLEASGLMHRDPNDVNRDLVTGMAFQMNATGVAVACTDHDLQYVISWLRLGTPVLQPVTPDPGEPKKQLHLYHCSDFHT